MVLNGGVLCVTKAALALHDFSGNYDWVCTRGGVFLKGDALGQQQGFEVLLLLLAQRSGNESPPELHIAVNKLAHGVAKEVELIELVHFGLDLTDQELEVMLQDLAVTGAYLLLVPLFLLIWLFLFFGGLVEIDLNLGNHTVRVSKCNLQHRLRHFLLLLVSVFVVRQVLVELCLPHDQSLRFLWPVVVLLLFL